MGFKLNFINSRIIIYAVRIALVLFGLIICFSNLPENEKKITEKIKLEKTLSLQMETILFEQSSKNALDLKLSGSITSKIRTISIVFSAIRSGSTFIGDILNAVSANYYHFEPLHFFEPTQRLSSANDINYLKNLLTCNYSGYKEYKYIQSRFYQQFNTRLWKYCADWKTNVCQIPTFLEKFCSLFPRHSMKIVAGKLSLAEHLLIDSRFNMKITLLVRDPRAVFASRINFFDCPTGPPEYCGIEEHCENVLEDYYEAKRLLQLFPNKFRVYRYEDFGLNPFKTSKSLLRFFELPYEEAVNDFLNKHTKINKSGKFSTYRNSSKTVSKWIHELNIEQILVVELLCAKLMDSLGYQNVTEKNMLQNKYLILD